MWSERLQSNKANRKVLSLFKFKFFTLLLFIVCMLSSCHERKINPNTNLQLSDYDSISLDNYRISPKLVRREIRNMLATDSDSTLSDYYARTYYVKHRSLVWIDRKGIDDRADTLAARLKTVTEFGFNTEQFRLQEIEADLKRVRNLDFEGKSNTISKVLGRLEYNLTKALFRYSAGQRFGYTNPNNILNRLDKRENSEAYATLYGLKSPYAKRSFYRQAVEAVQKDSLSAFLDASEPQNPYYKQLVRIFNSDSARYFNKQLLLVNMERCRWRMADYPWNHKKYVLVNVPSMHLRAIDGDKVLTMRIGCGSLKTKTPLLSSNIMRMDINPQWIMPRSIVKKSIIPRLGNRWYFKSRHYFIRDRATGKDIEPWQASPAALLDGSQLAIQEGGEGNSLGRIIFRFNNDFSIYLHDTSSRDVFERAERDVSHGCIRVEKPFELAEFLLGEGKRSTIEKIRYSMNADVSPLGKSKDELTEQEQAVADTLQKKMLIGKAEVKPVVPLFIWYFTLYPDENGKIQYYNDLYGYDVVIYHDLRNYL